MEVELVLDAHAEVGEGPAWDPASTRLVWVDITRSQVHLFDPSTASDISFDVGEHVGAAAPRAAGGLVLALRGGFGVLDLQTGGVEAIADTEASNPKNRMNDGKCDRAGRFWAGSMSYAETGNEGSLYRLEHDHSVVRVLSGVGLSNGLGWSPDDRLMYHVDSLAATVYVHDFDLESGSIANRRPLIEVTEGHGTPDGMTVDAEGCLWVAFWGGGAVRRYAPDGSLLQEVGLPVRQVSCCAFGGSDQGDLYITTASRGLSEQELREQPAAGGLFRFRPGVTGPPAHPYLD
ncbi:SMP-30/gluconolactonase/LRE family protein [Candidatus Nephthysia bennettiae]